MQVPSNTVTLDLRSGYRLVRGTFTIESHSAAPGLSTSDGIADGKVLALSPYGDLPFPTPDADAPDVAQWFHTRIRADRTTIGEEAREMSYACIGKLELTLAGGMFGTAEQKFTFFDIGFAQNATGTFWVGGSNCRFDGGGSVRATGAHAGLGAVTFTFRQAPGSAKRVSVLPVKVIDTGSWMKRIDGSRRLDAILIPASHQSGLSDMHHGGTPPFGDDRIRTQSAGIGAQLEAGARFFELGIAYERGQLLTARPSGQGTHYGQDLTQIFDEAIHFLADQPSETAIFRIGLSPHTGRTDPAEIKKRMDVFLLDYAEALYHCADPKVNLAKQRLDSVRGKIVLTFDYSDFVNPATGRFRAAEDAAAQVGANMAFTGSPSQTADVTLMKAEQSAQWDRSPGLGTGYFFVLHWFVSPGASDPVLAGLAEKANKALPQFLGEKTLRSRGPKPNIVSMDFLDAETAQSIVLYNFVK